MVLASPYLFAACYITLHISLQETWVNFQWSQVCDKKDDVAPVCKTRSKVQGAANEASASSSKKSKKSKKEDEDPPIIWEPARLSPPEVQAYFETPGLQRVKTEPLSTKNPPSDVPALQSHPLSPTPNPRMSDVKVKHENAPGSFPQKTKVLSLMIYADLLKFYFLLHFESSIQNYFSLCFTGKL